MVELLFEAAVGVAWLPYVQMSSAVFITSIGPRVLPACRQQSRFRDAVRAGQRGVHVARAEVAEGSGLRCERGRVGLHDVIGGAKDAIGAGQYMWRPSWRPSWLIARGCASMGVMQINQLWIGPLARRTGLPETVVRDRLLSDPCFNIAAAGLIMRTFLNETKGDLMRAVGNYHSHTPIRNFDYQAKVLDAARTIFASRM